MPAHTTIPARPTPSNPAPPVHAFLRLAACCLALPVLSGCIAQEIRDEIRLTNATLSEVKYQLDQTNKNLDVLKSDLANTNQLLTGVRTDLDSTNQLLTGVRTDLDNTNTALAGTNEDLTSTNQQLAILDGMQSSLAALDKHLASLRGSIEGINSAIPFINLSPKKLEDDEAATAEGQAAEGDPATSSTPPSKKLDPTIPVPAAPAPGATPAQPAPQPQQPK